MKKTDDLISRSAAIAEIEDYIEEYSETDPGTGLHSPKWCAMVEAKDVLAKLPAAQTCGWISVKDRLPDDASDVLVYYDNGTESRIIPVNYYKGCWYDCVFNRPIDDLETGFIGYWMSLPEPPKEENDATV